MKQKKEKVKLATLETDRFDLMPVQFQLDKNIDWSKHILVYDPVTGYIHGRKK